MTTERAIIHVDMDAFYASVEQFDDPALRGRPVIVGGLGGRGVVAAASYEARAFGVHSAMPMARARRLCPDAEYRRPRMLRYREVSGRVFAAFSRFTPLVEGLSLDEAFLDVTASRALFGDIEAIGAAIRDAIRADTGLEASVGMAPNKFLAKLASDAEKPRGFVHVRAGEVRAFLDPMPVARLWGVGRQTLPRLKSLGVHTIGQLRRADPAMLAGALGRRVAHFQALARGEDEREVVPSREEKSISHENTFDADLTDARDMLAELQRLAEAVAARVRAHALRGRTVTVKIRDARFRTVTRSRSLRAATDGTVEIYGVAAALFRRWREENPRTAVRLLGVGVSSLEMVSGAEAFRAPVAARLDRAMDEINRRYGDAAIAHGLSFTRARKKRG